MAGLNRSRGLDFLLSGNKIKEQTESEVKVDTSEKENSSV
mgnify:FL=1